MRAEASGNNFEGGHLIPYCNKFITETDSELYFLSPLILETSPPESASAEENVLVS